MSGEVNYVGTSQTFHERCLLRAGTGKRKSTGVKLRDLLRLDLSGRQIGQIGIGSTVKSRIPDTQQRLGTRCLCTLFSYARAVDQHAGTRREQQREVLDEVVTVGRRDEGVEW